MYCCIHLNSNISFSSSKPLFASLSTHPFRRARRTDHQKAILIETIGRGYIDRYRFRRLKSLAILVASLERRRVARWNFDAFRKKVIVVERVVRPVVRRVAATRVIQRVNRNAFRPAQFNKKIMRVQKKIRAQLATRPERLRLKRLIVAAHKKNFDLLVDLLDDLLEVRELLGPLRLP